MTDLDTPVESPDASPSVGTGRRERIAALGQRSGAYLVLLLRVIRDVIGALGSSYQSVVSGAFLVVVVMKQAYLSREQRL